MPKITLNISEAAMPQAEARAKSLGHASVEEWVFSLIQADFDEYQHQETLKKLEEGMASPKLSPEFVREGMRRHLEALHARAAQTT